MNNKVVERPTLVFLILCLVLKNHSSSVGAHDTLSVGESLSGDQTISSAKGGLELGFFKPGNSSNYYLGIWYKSPNKVTVPWVANRERPFSDRFAAELRFSGGNLVLLDGSNNATIWSTNAEPSNSSAVRAVILDNGNLVLRDGSNASEPLWESFDYPTDTWMPEGKIGFNKRTGEKYSFTSWKSPDDPAPGLFSFVPIPDDNIVVWNGTVEYWRTGSWDPKGRVFTLIPEMIANNFYEFTLVSKANESYYTYIVINGEYSRIVMDVTGQMKQLVLDNRSKEWNLYWTQPRHQCDVHAFCGPFGTCDETPSPSCTCLRGFEPKAGPDWASANYLGGCARRTQLQCGGNRTAAKPDRFLRMPSVQLPEKARPVGAAGDASACESACLNDCSCAAYSFAAGSCLAWTEELINLELLDEGDERGRVMFVRLAASELRVHKLRKEVVAGLAAGCAAGLVCLVAFLARRRERARRLRVGTGMEVSSLVAFGYRDLQSATKNFSEKLGGGGFGSVFRGTLPDSSQVAVKKLESLSQGEKQFRAEVATIGAVQHVNLVRLRGFCSERAHKLLVYDYMPNGSLCSHLFQEKNPNGSVLDWKARYQIALGTARGLAYLHEKCRECIIHCDIKPENILLDSELSPKVADFGLAKLVGRDFSRVLTSMRGTIGYLAPEWIAGVAINPKADVYSYGMTLFELVSGRRNSENSQPDSRANYFPSVAAEAVVQSNGDLVSLLDPRLHGDVVDVDQLQRVCRVACWCIQDHESHRPSMGQVVQILEGMTDVNLPPIPRSLYFYDAN